jgi:hypothetical protein
MRVYIHSLQSRRAAILPKGTGCTPFALGHCRSLGFGMDSEPSSSVNLSHEFKPQHSQDQHTYQAYARFSDKWMTRKFVLGLYVRWCPHLSGDAAMNLNKHVYNSGPLPSTNGFVETKTVHCKAVDLISSMHRNSLTVCDGMKFRTCSAVVWTLCQ